MKPALSSFHQTLTPEAATVLRHSIAEAARRSHAHTTPLHVAATLLHSPSGNLRQACIKSHPNSSHPLHSQCRALELCFSVALERLPASQRPDPAPDPPLSNALTAALKRAQAHQRKGSPDHHQQPPSLFASKVDLQQLIVSILDDPSVSRVMREARFSSPAVKATIEQSLSSNPAPSPAAVSGLIEPGFRRNLCPTGSDMGSVSEEVKRVVEILARSKKRNPVLVGESESEAKSLVKEVLNWVEENNGIKIEVIPSQIAELGATVETRLAESGSGGVVLNLGDLKWLVEQAGAGGNQLPELGKAAVAEIGRLVSKFRGRVWLIGRASCETHLRCQVYHPTLENEWDLQAFHVAGGKASLSGIFPRLGTTGFLGHPLESFSPLKPFTTVAITPLKQQPPDNPDPASKPTNLCSQCSLNYEQEMAKHVTKDLQKPTDSTLPPWLKNATSREPGFESLNQPSVKDQEMIQKQKSIALQKKWHNTCSRLHPDHHRSSRVSERLTTMPSSGRIALQLNANLSPKQTPKLLSISPPASPVRTELVLGRHHHPKVAEDKLDAKITSSKDLLQISKLLDKLDAESFNKLLKGLVEKVWWQEEAASKLATVITQCKLGSSKRSRGSNNLWLLFTGPDKIGKKKMAVALSELVRQSNPVIFHLGSSRDDHGGLGGGGDSFRGKTVVDRIVEAVRRNPFSVVVLEDFDEADVLVKGSVKRAMEKGRLVDSHGRETTLGNVIFILTAGSLPGLPGSESSQLDERKLANFVSGGWQLRLSVCAKTAKRRAGFCHWLDERQGKPKKETGLSFDLNEADSSDVTVDHEDEEHFLCTTTTTTTSSISSELLDSLDETIVFKPVGFESLRRDVSDSIAGRASSIIGDANRLEIQVDALEKIAGGLCLGHAGLEEWTEKVLVPSLRQVRMKLPTGQPMVVRLEPDRDSVTRSPGDWLPSSVRVI